jgi:phage/plasmid-associated DNA primase
MENFNIDRDHEDFDRLDRFYIDYQRATLENLLSQSLSKLELNFDNIFIWCQNTYSWKIRNKEEICIFIKNNILFELERIEIEFDILSKYLTNSQDVKTVITETKKKLNSFMKEIRNAVNLQINSTYKNRILFNNQFPFLIGFGDKYVLDLKTKDIRIRNHDDYFLYNIEYRNIKEVNEDCFPISDWFSKSDLPKVQLILGSFLTGEQDQIFYMFQGEGANGKSFLLEILKVILGEYFISVSEDLFSNKNTVKLENQYRLANRRLIVLDTQEIHKINEAKLIALIEKYKNSKFILCLNEVPNFTDKYSTKRRLINISFEYTFKPVPKFPKDKKIKKNLEIDYDYVFSWLLEGCSRYINSSKTITDLVSSYIDKYSIFEENVFDKFINSRIIVTNNVKNYIGFKDLYSFYMNYEDFLNTKPENCLKEKQFIKIAKSKFVFKKTSKGYIFCNIKKAMVMESNTIPEENLEDLLNKHENILFG